MRVTAIIAAAGAGHRIGAAVPKQFLDLGGATILARSVAVFDAHPDVTEIVVVLPPAHASGPPPLPSTRTPLHVTAGGARRQDSVANAFDLVETGADVVL